MSKQFIVLVGPPNSGKSTLFNQLTGNQTRVVNYPGATVDIVYGAFRKGSEYCIVDTPGIYSFLSSSEDERVTIQTLTNMSLVSEANKLPDLVLSVIDIQQLSRHLLHTLELIEKGFPVCVIINDRHLFSNTEVTIDCDKLQHELGVPVFKMDILKSVQLKPLEAFLKNYRGRKFSLQNPKKRSVKESYDTIEAMLFRVNYSIKETKKTFDLDYIFLHPFIGPFVFIGVMALFFYSIFSLATPLMDIIDSSVAAINSGIHNLLPSHWITVLLADGVIAGIGAVIIFVPQIALLFLGLGVLESSGYLARGAVIIDKPFSLIGLNGRCFVPLLSGYACAIPALLATRHIQQEKIKRLCCFIIPLMQCSARLPVYGLLLALLFGNDTWKSGLLLTGIYCGSMILASLVVLCISPFVSGVTSNQFNIELPKWKKPRLKEIVPQVYAQTMSFVSGAGPMIVLISLFLWAISVFPSEEHSFAMSIGQYIEPIFLPMGLDWRVGVAILFSFAAREVFVSALVVLFSLTSGEQGALVTTLSEVTFLNSNQLIFTPASIAGLLFFFMVAMQCGATLAVVKKEMKSNIVPIVQLLGYIILAYGGAVLLFQLLS